MKKYTSTLLALLLAGTFIGCGSSNDTKAKEDTNTSTPDVPKEETTPPVQEQTQKMPTCYIKEGTPKTDSSIVVHAKCKDGNIPIDEAKVTLDNTVKSVDYKGVYFSDYIGFDNLQPSTTYKAILEVVVGGKTIKESVKIKTRKEEVVITPTPTPTPVVDLPKWTKDFYDTNVIFTDDDFDVNQPKIILNLNKVCSVKSNSKIKFSVVNIELSSGGNAYDDIVIIKENLLQVQTLTSFLYGSMGYVIVTVRAKTEYGFRDAKIKFLYKLTPFEQPLG